MPIRRLAIPECSILKALSPRHHRAHRTAEDITLSAAALQATRNIDNDALLSALSFLYLVELRLLLISTTCIRTDDVLRALLEHGNSTQSARDLHCALFGRSLRVYFLQCTYVTRIFSVCLMPENIPRFR